MNVGIARSPSGARRWLILDRDGVINHDSADYIRSVADWRPIPGALEAISRLSAAGFGLAVATNQSGVGRGYFSLATLNAIHARLLQAVTKAGGHIEAIAYCPHTPAESCGCRKPAPGLLLRLMADCGFAPADSVMIGDAQRDLEAARAAAVACIAVGTGAVELGTRHGVPAFADLEAAADWLLQGHWPC